MKNRGRTIDYLILGGIVAVWTILMIIPADMQSFWMDDIAQIDISWQDSFAAMIKENIRVDNNPPLSHILCFWWIRMVPYGTGWLKLFNILWSAAGIYVCGLCGFKVKNRLTGITAAVLCCSTYGMFYFSAYTFRPYGMLFFFSIFSFYMYMEYREKGGMGRKVIYTITLIAMVYTHYFGILICMAFGIYDFFLICKRKARKSDIVPYITAALLILPWLLIVMSNSISRLETFWPDKPSLASIPNVIYELMGYNRAMEYIVILCVFGSLIYVLINIKKTGELWRLKLALYLPVFVIGFVYIFSRYSTQFTSLFVPRYFICIFPYLMVATGFFCAELVDFGVKIVKKKLLIRVGYGIICLGFAFCILKNANNVYENSKNFNQPFKETADYLMEQKDIYDENTMVFCSNKLDLQRGWEYYLTHKGERKSVPVTWHRMTAENLETIDKVYLVTLHSPLEESVLQILENEGFKCVKEDLKLPVKIYQK